MDFSRVRFWWLGDTGGPRKLRQNAWDHLCNQGHRVVARLWFSCLVQNKADLITRHQCTNGIYLDSSTSFVVRILGAKLCKNQHFDIGILVLDWTRTSTIALTLDSWHKISENPDKYGNCGIWYVFFAKTMQSLVSALFWDAEVSFYCRFRVIDSVWHHRLFRSN